MTFQTFVPAEGTVVHVGAKSPHTVDFDVLTTHSGLSIGTSNVVRIPTVFMIAAIF